MVSFVRSCRNAVCVLLANGGVCLLRIPSAQQRRPIEFGSDRAANAMQSSAAMKLDSNGGVDGEDDELMPFNVTEHAKPTCQVLRMNRRQPLVLHCFLQLVVSEQRFEDLESHRAA
jgi:hypothetical protein